MTGHRIERWLRAPLLLALALSAAPAAAQQSLLAPLRIQEDVAFAPAAVEAPPSAPLSAEDERMLARAARDRGRHVVVSLAERKLWLREGSNVLYTAPVGIGKPVVLEYEGQVWDFRTPEGERRVLRKQENPLWVPPDWHYLEVALSQGWTIVWVHPDSTYALRDGGAVRMSGKRLGRVDAAGRFEPVARGEELVIDRVLYAPPTGSVNRQIPGQLGRFKIDLGDSYYLHGTPNP